MKKLLFIANFNPVMKEVNQALMDFFQVQICPAKKTSAESILLMYEPDAIIVFLTGFDPVETTLFNMLINLKPRIPVISIGTERESKICNEYIADGSFRSILRPVKNEEIIRIVCETVGLDAEEEFERVYKDKDTRKHILCVDDSGVMLRKIKELIPDEYRVSMVNSGTKAITMIEKDRPDLIFLDYDMPVIDGRQTLEMIRSEVGMKDLPVVFMTGKRDRPSIESVLNLNPSGYLLKPPVATDIVSTIEKILKP